MHSVLDWMNCFNSWLVPDSLKMDACLASFAGFSSVIDLLGQFLFLVGGAGTAGRDTFCRLQTKTTFN